MSCVEKGDRPFSHRSGEAYIKDGVCHVQIPRCASQAWREYFIAQGWKKCCIYEVDAKFVFATIREPIERQRSGWSEWTKRYGGTDSQICKPFVRDDHTTPQSWFLRGIPVDHCILLEDLANGIATVNSLIEMNLSSPNQTHAADYKPDTPKGKVLMDLCRHLAEDLILYRYWQEVNAR